MQAITREEIFNNLLFWCENRQICEDVRCGRKPLPKEDFIEYAHIKDELYPDISNLGSGELAARGLL